MDQRPRIPLTQLIDPTNTPRQNQHRRQTQKAHENLERPRQRRWGRRRAARSPPPVGVLEGEGDEDEEGEDLEGEAGDGDVDGGVGAARGGGGEGAADGLEDEGEDVAGDEDPVVGFGREAGVLGAEVEDSFAGGKGVLMMED